ncbi:MAG: hypothetical protein WCK06_03005 [Actinomycetota bacterium]
MSKKGSSANRPAPTPYEPAVNPAWSADRRASRGGPPALRKVLARLSGARLCYGKPVRSGERVVVPVAQVWATGGYGFGAGGDPGHVGDGGGGGGSLRAKPVGFIDIGPEGAAYHAIPDTRGRAARTAALAGSLAVGGAVGFALAAGAVGTVAVSRRLRVATPGRTVGRPARRQWSQVMVGSPRRSRRR